METNRTVRCAWLAISTAFAGCGHATSPTAESCVTVLVTDGTPTTCSTDETALTAIIADGYSKGIQTYALALPGSDIAVLNQYAQAGGTGKAVDVSGGPQVFIAALNAIRAKLTPVGSF